MSSTTASPSSDDGDDSTSWTGFHGKTWQVHKFGGTSVANAECFRSCAAIVEDQLGLSSTGDVTQQQHPGHLNLAAVVSAMGGKPKVTDLLLNSVKAAAGRDQEGVDSYLNLVLEKHTQCLSELFGESSDDKDRLLGTIQHDLRDIQDILKTVSLMKWQASRISELVSGYGELWSAQILAQLLHNRSAERNELATRHCMKGPPRQNMSLYLWMPDGLSLSTKKPFPGELWYGVFLLASFKKSMILNGSH